MKISTSFTAVGVGGGLRIDHKDKLLLSVSGTFDADVYLEKSNDGGLSWVTVTTKINAAKSLEILNDSKDGLPAVFRMRCTRFASGTVVTSVEDVDTILKEFVNRKGEPIFQILESGTKTFGEAQAAQVQDTTVAGLAIQNKSVGALKKLVFTLTNMIVPVVSVTTGPGVGGTKIIDLPEGILNRLGCVAKLSVSVATAKQANFTDATPEGDIGVGTAAPADADALGTDATDDDFATSTPFTMAAYASPLNKLGVEAAGIHDGSTTPIPVFVNIFVDAADIADGISTEVLVNGTIELTYADLGDY